MIKQIENIPSEYTNSIWRSNIRSRDSKSICKSNLICFVFFCYNQRTSSDQDKFVWDFFFNFKDQKNIPFGFLYVDVVL